MKKFAEKYGLLFIVLAIIPGFLGPAIYDILKKSEIDYVFSGLISLLIFLIQITSFILLIRYRKEIF